MACRITGWSAISRETLDLLTMPLMRFVANPKKFPLQTGIVLKFAYISACSCTTWCWSSRPSMTMQPSSSRIWLIVALSSEAFARLTSAIVDSLGCRWKIHDRRACLRCVVVYRGREQDRVFDARPVTDLLQHRQ